MQLLAHPFRIGPAGVAATVTDGTDEAYAEELARLIATRRGERPMVPAYGIAEPAFDELDVTALNAVLGLFGPPVTVTDVDVDYPDDRTARLVVTFE